MRSSLGDRLIFRLRNRVLSLGRLRSSYWKILGMKIGGGTHLSHIYVTWPHQVEIGNNCCIEHGVYFHFDGIHRPGPSIRIGDGCFLGTSCEFNIREGIEISYNCAIGAGSRFIDHDHNIQGLGPLPSRDGPQAPIRCEHDVWIGANVVVLKGVNISHGAVVAAGAVVVKNVPSNEIWGGIPARKIGERKPLPKIEPSL